MDKNVQKLILCELVELISDLKSKHNPSKSGSVWDFMNSLEERMEMVQITAQEKFKDILKEELSECTDEELGTVDYDEFAERVINLIS